MAGEFGAVLRRLRENAGLTQDELERRAGVSVSTIRGLETGKRGNPRMTTVRQLADALALRREEREELLRAAVPGRRAARTPPARRRRARGERPKRSWCRLRCRCRRRRRGARWPASAWQPVLRNVREPSPDGSPAPLATVLSTPLMVALARTVYNDTPDHDPAELLDIPGKQELAEHLLDNFLPTVYWDPERVQRWLGHLARHLTESRTPDLAWWRLGHGLRRSTRTLVTALVIGLVDGVMSVGFSGSVIGGVLDGTIVGLLAGLLFGLVRWFTYTVTGKGLRPSAVRLCTRGRPETTTWRAGPRLVIGTLGGALFGCVYGFMVGLLRAFSRHFGLSTALEIGLVDANAFGLIFGGAAGLTFCLLETPLDIVSAVSPGSVLRTDRRTVLTQLCFRALVFGTAVGFGAGVVVNLLQGHPGQLAADPTASILLGTISGLGGALGYTLTLTAWGQWCLLTRIWLPLTGRPWAVAAFLDDAYQRGVLRQAGAVYQFRHARLQSRLAQGRRRG
ncbi:helix-turn-helix transcriptional regulator [Streptomyces misionensis]|uniref:helix-turn-helix transcriptional regulator n=1 Tax=Streptomyces misionensis TaxID=67331 RepID=UPI0033CE2A26